MAYVFPAISMTFIIFICAPVIAINRDYRAPAPGELAVVVLAVFCLNIIDIGVVRRVSDSVAIDLNSIKFVLKTCFICGTL